MHNNHEQCHPIPSLATKHWWKKITVNDENWMIRIKASKGSNMGPNPPGYLHKWVMQLQPKLLITVTTANWGIDKQS